MQIICPNCSTSYAVTAAALGPEGRNVRCAKCKEVWHATPHQAIVEAMAQARPAAGTELPGPLEQPPQTDEWHGTEPPRVDSPSIVSNPPGEAPHLSGGTWDEEAVDDSGPTRPTRGFGRGGVGRSSPRFRLTLPAAIAAMAAVALGLIVSRSEIVRLLPQTAAFFKLTGMPVNLRGLDFENVHVNSELVDGTPVLVIDGFVTSRSAKPVEIPRLRLVVRDAQGAPIYAWNALLEQAVLPPGEKTPFKTRLASPPANAHDLIVRFFTKRDVATGGA